MIILGGTKGPMTEHPEAGVRPFRRYTAPWRVPVYNSLCIHPHLYMKHRKLVHWLLVDMFC